MNLIKKKRNYGDQLSESYSQPAKGMLKYYLEKERLRNDYF
ncbi:hypothetical protein [Streptococcus equi]|nr:hypothetical protein [Streptococcus equi]